LNPDSIKMKWDANWCKKILKFVLSFVTGVEKKKYHKTKIWKKSFDSIEKRFQTKIYLDKIKLLSLKVHPYTSFNVSIITSKNLKNKKKIQWANFKCLNLCTYKKSKTSENTHYQVNNLANVASLLWFTFNVKIGNYLDLLGVYGFKWSICM